MSTCHLCGAPTLLSHRQLSAWYHQLAQQLEAGLLLADALRAAQGTGIPAAGTDTLALVIERGGTVDAVFDAAAPWLPTADRLVLTAAAHAGRMPRVLHSLSDRHGQMAAAHRRVLVACLYPTAVLHLGLLLLPLMRMVDWEKGFAWDPLAYLRLLAETVVPLWLLVIAVVVLIRRQSPLVGLVARRLPLIGGYLRAQSLADFAFALGNFLDAGVMIDSAWSVAGSITTSPLLRKAAQSIATVIDQGEPPGRQLAAWPCFPADFVALYKSGEISGQLEANLLRLSTAYQEKASHALKLATMFYPALLFLIVAATVVFNTVKFYAGYLKMIENLAS